jgi:hypothetical protein
MRLLRAHTEIYSQMASGRPLISNPVLEDHLDYWIVNVHTQNRPMGLNLGFNENDYKLVWAGMSRMSSYCVVSLVHSMVNCFGLPYAVLIHCGGNDIGIEPCGKLLFDMKFVFCNSSNAPW